MGGPEIPRLLAFQASYFSKAARTEARWRLLFLRAETAEGQLNAAGAGRLPSAVLDTHHLGLDLPARKGKWIASSVWPEEVTWGALA